MDYCFNTERNSHSHSHFYSHFWVLKSKNPDFRLFYRLLIKMERVKGIEPSSQPWEGHILPLNHTRLRHRQLLSECRSAGNWFASLSQGFKLADRGAQSQFNRGQPVRLFDFPAVNFTDIKTVHCRAALGHDARSGNVQPLLGEGL